MSRDLSDGFNPLRIDREEAYRRESLEGDERQYEWYADIATYEEYVEIEMLYVFQDSEDEVLESLRGNECFYRFEPSGKRIYPIVDLLRGETRVKAFIPISRSLDHEVSEFPSHFLDDIREDFYEKVISENL